MKKLFSVLHARALAHATEDLGKVKAAMTNAIGNAQIVVSHTQGHHGNPIAVLEATVHNAGDIHSFFERFEEVDLLALIDSLERRIDDGCNLFIKIDKQEAYAGKIRLGRGDDVISVRIRAVVFPPKRDAVKEALLAYLADLAESKRSKE